MTVKRIDKKSRLLVILFIEQWSLENSWHWLVNTKDKKWKFEFFKQRISQTHESEIEINEWLVEQNGKIDIQFVQQSTYLTDNTESGQPSYVVSVWYQEL